MHYDTRDNILYQLCGKKRILLYPPNCDAFLNVEGSSARIQFVRGLATLEEENYSFKDVKEREAYALFERVRLKRAIVCTLNPGEALFIPALWFHRVTSLPCEDEECLTPSVAINVFYNDARLLKGEVAGMEYDARDVYGNKDIVVGRESIKKASEIGAKLDALPEPYRTFYARRCLNEIAQQLGTVLKIPSSSSSSSSDEIDAELAQAFQD